MSPLGSISVAKQDTEMLLFCTILQLSRFAKIASILAGNCVRIYPIFCQYHPRERVSQALNTRIGRRFHPLTQVVLTWSTRVSGWVKHSTRALTDGPTRWRRWYWPD